jgi:hypothetical protein
MRAPGACRSGPEGRLRPPNRCPLSACREPARLPARGPHQPAAKQTCAVGPGSGHPAAPPASPRCLGEKHAAMTAEPHWGEGGLSAGVAFVGRPWNHTGALPAWVVTPRTVMACRARPGRKPSARRGVGRRLVHPEKQSSRRWPPGRRRRRGHGAPATRSGASAGRLGPGGTSRHHPPYLPYDGVGHNRLERIPRDKRHDARINRLRRR